MANEPDTTAQEGQAIQPTIADRFRNYLDVRAEEDKSKGGADQLNEKAVTAILQAQTEDEVWDADTSGLIAAQNLVGAEIEVRSLIIRDRQREDIDPGFLGNKWALCECVAIAVPTEVEATTGLQPGAEFMMDTGVATILTKIRWFEANDKLPVRGVIKGITTANGNTVLQFTRPPKRAIQAQAEAS
jgi:hypothetical protein